MICSFPSHIHSGVNSGDEAFSLRLLDAACIIRNGRFPSPRRAPVRLHPLGTMRGSFERESIAEEMLLPASPLGLVCPARAWVGCDDRAAYLRGCRS